MLGLYQGQEREVRAEGVPDGVEVFVMRLVRIPPSVLARKVVRHVVTVEERGVEDAPLLFGAAFNLYLAERLLPSRLGATAHGVAVPVGSLAQEVRARTLWADERHADFHQDGSRVRGVERGVGSDLAFVRGSGR